MFRSAKFNIRNTDELFGKTWNSLPLCKVYAKDNVQTVIKTSNTLHIVWSRVRYSLLKGGIRVAFQIIPKNISKKGTVFHVSWRRKISASCWVPLLMFPHSSPKSFQWHPVIMRYVSYDIHPHMVNNRRFTNAWGFGYLQEAFRFCLNYSSHRALA